MATIQFSMTSTPLTGSKSFAGTDQDMSDLLAWAAVAYKSLITTMFAPQVPAPGGGTMPDPNFVPTNAQIGAGLATATIRLWIGAVQNFKDQAAKAALTPPAPGTWN